MSVDKDWWKLEPNDDDQCDDMWGVDEDDEEEREDEEESEEE
jgi:hypothetical protein